MCNHLWFRRVVAHEVSVAHGRVSVCKSAISELRIEGSFPSDMKERILLVRALHKDCRATTDEMTSFVNMCLLFPLCYLLLDRDA